MISMEAAQRTSPIHGMLLLLLLLLLPLLPPLPSRFSHV